MTPIVVGTNPDREKFLDNFMKDVPSFFRNYIYVASTWNMELGAIQEGALVFDRFAFVQDTMKVHNWITFMDALNRHHTSYIIPRPSCYAMVYDSELVRQVLVHVGMPGQDKELAITGETMFCDNYESLHRIVEGTELPVLYPEMTDGNALANASFDYTFYTGGSADGGEDKPRLHLRSNDGAFSKYKATYR